MADDHHRGYGRATQSDVYRAGLSGTRPAVPVDAEATMAANRAAFARGQICQRVNAARLAAMVASAPAPPAR